MGMDIYAIQPEITELDHYRMTHAGWSELGRFIWNIAPSVEALIGDHWWSNDGFFVDHEASQRIAAEIMYHVDLNGVPPNDDLSLELMRFAAFANNSGGFEIC